MFSLHKDAENLRRNPRILRLVIVALFAEIGYATLNISCMPVYLKYDRHFSPSMVGIVLATFLLSEAIFKSFMGTYADRFGRKLFIAIGPLCSVFTSIATLLVPHNFGVWEEIMIIGFRVIDGLGAAMLWPAAFALAADLVEESKQQQVMSLLNVCYLVGIALALPIGGMVNDITGTYAGSFILSAILFSLVSLTTFFGLPSDKEYTHKRIATYEGQLMIYSLLDSIKNIPGFILLAALTFAGVFFPMANIKIFARQQFDLSETTFGLIVLPAAIGMAILSFPMSKFGQKLGHARAVHYGNGLCSIGLIIIATGAFLPFMRNLLIIGLAGIPVALGFLLSIPAWYSSVSEIDPGKRGTNIGAVMTAQGLGSIVGTSLGGFCYEKFQVFGATFGRYSPFIGCALFITASWLISLKVLHVNNKKLA